MEDSVCGIGCGNTCSGDASSGDPWCYKVPNYSKIGPQAYLPKNQLLSCTKFLLPNDLSSPHEREQEGIIV